MSAEYWHRSEGPLLWQDWPEDRTGKHLFVLDALNRIGRFHDGEYWERQPGYFCDCGRCQLPADISKADRTAREIAHKILYYGRVQYKPDFRIATKAPAGGLGPSGIGQYEFSPDDWREAVSLSARLQNIFEFDFLFSPFKSAAQFIINAAVKGDLHTFGSPFGAGEFKAIPTKRWNNSFEDLKARFAFGRFTPEKFLVDADPRGTHVIFVNANEVERLLKPKTPLKGSIKAETDVTNWLVAQRQTGDQRATRAVYEEYAVERFGVTPWQFKKCWSKARSLEPQPKGIWGKTGTRTASEEIK
jgi:hypothetical protein